MERRKRETVMMAVAALTLLGILTVLIAQDLKTIDTRAAEPAQKVEAEEIHVVEEIEEIEAAETPETPEEQADSYPLTDEEFYAVCAVVMAESGGEPYEGQLAVAQCIRNACELDGIRPQEAIRNYRYTKPAKSWTESVSKAVNAVFWQGEKAVDEPIRWFYAPALCRSDWHENALTFAAEIGGHRFFR